MAAAEARTAWQRMANRCFVQEDAKRAPKLACCPSSLPQCDSGSCDAVNGPDHPSSTFVPLNWNPVNSNLPPETKWWLQLQPNFGYQKDFTCEQLSALEEELEEKRGENESPCKLTVTGAPLPCGTTDVDLDKNVRSSLQSPWMVSTIFMKHESEARVEELKTVNSNFQQPLKPKADLGEHWCNDEELMNWKAVDRLISKNPEKACFDLETPWVGSEKAEPWWRIADKDELASLVAQKSLHHIENCDLPRPQKVHVSRDPYTCLESFEDNGVLSSLDHKLHAGICNPIEYGLHSSTSGSLNAKPWLSGEAGLLSCNSGKLHSSTHTCEHASENDSSRAELLEALRHSQTRAREAERAAQKACDEKEHIVKLLFKQASHLFAYRQWLQVLQLEKLLLQLKVKDHHISTLFPDLPWMPLKGNKVGEGRCGAKEKREGKKQRRCNICKNAVAFAVGLGLAGAGLLLGWTLGWLLPAF